MSGVLIGKILFFSGIEHSNTQVDALKASGQYQSYLHEETMRVIPPYMVIGGVILVMAFMIWKVKFPAETETGTHDQLDTTKKGSHGHFSNCSNIHTS